MFGHVDMVALTRDNVSMCKLVMSRATKLTKYLRVALGVTYVIHKGVSHEEPKWHVYGA